MADKLKLLIYGGNIIKPMTIGERTKLLAKHAKKTFPAIGSLEFVKSNRIYSSLEHLENEQIYIYLLRFEVSLREKEAELRALAEKLSTASTDCAHILEELTSGAVAYLRNTTETPTKIVVNGKQKIVDLKSVSFADVMLLAFGEDPTRKPSDFVVTWVRRHGLPSDGTMSDGDSMEVQERMIFTAGCSHPQESREKSQRIEVCGLCSAWKAFQSSPKWRTDTPHPITMKTHEKEVAQENDDRSQ